MTNLLSKGSVHLKRWVWEKKNVDGFE